MKDEKTASLGPVWRCAYRSRQTAHMTRADLAALLRESQMRNVSADVSGLLLHIDDSFLQYLEAPEPVLRGLAQRLVSDLRHAQMGWLFFEPSAHRLLEGQALAFSDWSSPMPLEEGLQWQLQQMLSGPLPVQAPVMPSTTGQLNFWRHCAAGLPQ